jgi:hypothetical protein
MSSKKPFSARALARFTLAIDEPDRYGAALGWALASLPKGLP